MLENEILSRTDNRKSLDDVVHYLWQRYEQAGEAVTYQKIFDYLETIIPNGIDYWWQAYLVNNEPIYLYEFEENPPDFSVRNPTPENRDKGVSKSVTLSWEVENPKNKPLLYDLYLSELESNNSPMEAQYTELNSLSKSVSLRSKTRYIWRVRAYDEEGSQYYTPVFFFETE